MKLNPIDETRNFKCPTCGKDCNTGTSPGEAEWEFPVPKTGSSYMVFFTASQDFCDKCFAREALAGMAQATEVLLKYLTLTSENKP
jgi:hypothetical protein